MHALLKFTIICLCTSFILSSSNTAKTLPEQITEEEAIIAELDPHYYSSEDDLYKVYADFEKSGNHRRFFYIQ